MSSEVPLPAFHFEVDFGGESGAFAEVDGLRSERRVHGYRNGDEPTVRVLVEPARPDPVTLRRGIVGSLDLHRWYRSAEPRDVMVSLLDAEHAPAQRWRLHGCRPVAIAGPRLDSLQGRVAIEELVLQPESIEVE